MRDYIDSNREISPLRKAKDAIEIDNSNLSMEEQFKKAMDFAQLAIKNQSLNS
ncbi:MAG: (d)CMP kinase [Ferruginibacter sp.]